MTKEALSPRLPELLACPGCDDRPRVEICDEVIRCPKCGRTYPIEGGIPIMLIEKATLPKEQGGPIS